MTTTTHQQGIAATATLVHGYTLADVERAARISVAKHTFSMAYLNQEERYDAAYHAVVEHLYSCGCGRGPCRRNYDVAFQDLLSAGIRGIDKELQADRRNDGRDTRTGGESAAFVKFWLPPRKSKHYDDDGFTDQLCDRVALRAALAALTTEQYDVIAATAAFDNSGPDAASALGLTRDVYKKRLKRTRDAIREVWTGDLPPARVVDTCSRGHSRAEHGWQRQDGKYLKWQCRECSRAANRESLRRRRARERLERETSAH